ncbi:general stress protein [Brachybacterium saurashtrense]|uniref:General stress protein 17M-like domain-containing protein n=1 Tax=Brachybacterium saurashtrense TaxID=556288 RepID=A0A345YTI3_9MICO|nr:general stress protein [Brachybacterium saurashtrense]AXK47235.1 hypothetical protein DWV08_09420 [Brachybacterium saurashtrense]RRR24823.1 hypothetical protein DXU92_01165 [Brachybacterium saurashtrense]
MTQPPQSPRSASPLTARLYDLEYPRSLGVYSTYQEVQSVVDTLADEQFPVQSTLIVGTDLKLMERVTGRKTWPGVILQGARSGLVMGLFMGLLLWLLNPGNLMIVLPALVLGIVFFTVSAVVGYAMTGGRRDFTSMTATIPMQYELLVEHKHAAQARQILAASGAAPASLRSPAPMPSPQTAPTPVHPGTGAPDHGADAAGAPGAAPAPPQRAHRPSFGRPAAAPEAGSSPAEPSAARPRTYGPPAPHDADSPYGAPGEQANGRPASDPAPEPPSQQTPPRRTED